LKECFECACNSEQIVLNKLVLDSLIQVQAIKKANPHTRDGQRIVQYSM